MDCDMSSSLWKDQERYFLKTTQHKYNEKHHSYLVQYLLIKLKQHSMFSQPHFLFSL